jgi:hypothetical protein
MNYATRVKLNLMKGRAFKSRGQGIAGMGDLPHMRIYNNNRSTGTISHRAVVGALDPLMQQLSITKAAPKKKTTSGKSGGGAKKTNYKSLKFNF